MDSCERFADALDRRDWAWMVADGMIVECPICGQWEANGNAEVADAFGLEVGDHGCPVDNHCATLGVAYMPADSPYASTCYTHEGE